MSNLTIKDLTDSHELDRKAASAILGGINEWIHIPQASVGSPIPSTSFNIYNTYVDNDYILIQPQIFNIGNGVENSGNIAYNLDPQFVSAVSPINVQA